MKIKKWTIKGVIFSLLFVVVSFIRYFPTKWIGSHPSLSHFLGHDAQLYFQGIAGMSSASGAGYGHTLTLFVSEVVKILSPNSVEGLAFLGVFSLIYVWVAYYFIEDEIEHKWVVFFLIPFALVIHRIATNGNYGPVLAVSLAMLSFVFWRKGRNFLSGLSLVSSVGAHFWAGSLFVLVFGVYFLVSPRVNPEKIKQKWKFFIPFIPLIFIFGLKQGLLIRWVDFFLFFQSHGSDLFTCFATNPTNMENLGILGLVVIGSIFLYKRKKLSETWIFTSVWAGVFTILIVLLWGGQTFRIWTMIPFIFPAIYGFDRMIEESDKVAIVGIVTACILSGYLGI